MNHAPDGALRRVLDEPFAVADATLDHLAGCRRCQTRQQELAARAGCAARVLARPQPAPDVDRGWADLQRRLADPGSAHRRTASSPIGRGRRWAPGPRWAGVSLKSGAVAAGVAVVVAGSAAAATVGGVFAPTHVAPVTISAGDLQALSGFVDLADPASTVGFPTASGSGTLPFGTLRWASAGAARTVGSAAAARSATGLTVPLPSHLPAGVGPAAVFAVQPRLTATVTFDARAGKLAGATAVVNGGPAVFVGYGSTSGSSDLPALGVLTMPRPTASVRGASIADLEDFLLSRPGVPPQLGQEIRLLGNPSSVLPIPTLSGMHTESVRVGRWPAVLISVPSGAGAGVVWEDSAGTVHVVAGLVDQKDVLDVANQLR
jgi:hypothetical protein